MSWPDVYRQVNLPHCRVGEYDTDECHRVPVSVRSLHVGLEWIDEEIDGQRTARLQPEWVGAKIQVLSATGQIFLWFCRSVSEVVNKNWPAVEYYDQDGQPPVAIQVSS